MNERLPQRCTGNQGCVLPCHQGDPIVIPYTPEQAVVNATPQNMPEP